MNTRVIKTNLVGKEEVFKIIALGEITQLPVLLNGAPGVAKTATVLHYMGGKYNSDPVLATEKTFIVELDESTKASQVKGQLDLSSFVKDNKWGFDSPIARATAVIINEVDKANSGCRNGLLSVMRERKVFTGNQAPINCNWEVFVGTTNSIPADEKDSPFWDRFVIKHDMERASIDSLVTASQGENLYSTIAINMPTRTEYEGAINSISKRNIKIFMQEAQKSLTDRTLTFIPKIAAACMFVYNMTEEEALLKTAELMCKEVLPALSKKFEDPIVIQCQTLLQNIQSLTDTFEMFRELDNLEARLKLMTVQKKYQMKSAKLLQDLANIIRSKPALQDYITNIKGQSLLNYLQQIAKPVTDEIDPFESVPSSNGSMAAQASKF